MLIINIFYNFIEIILFIFAYFQEATPAEEPVQEQAAVEQSLEDPAPVDSEDSVKNSPQNADPEPRLDGPVSSDDGRELNNNAVESASPTKQAAEEVQSDTVQPEEASPKDPEVDKPLQDTEPVDNPSHEPLPDQTPVPAEKVNENALEDPKQADKSLQDPELFNSWHKNPVSPQEAAAASKDDSLQEPEVLNSTTVEEKPLQDPAPISASVEEDVAAVDQPEQPVEATKESVEAAPVDDSPQDPEPVVESPLTATDNAQQDLPPSEQSTESPSEKPLEAQPPADIAQQDVLPVSESVEVPPTQIEEPVEERKEVPAPVVESPQDAPKEAANLPNETEATLPSLAEQLALESATLTPQSPPIDESVIDLATACGQESVLLDEISEFHDANAYVMAEPEAPSPDPAGDATPVQPQRTRAV